MKQNFIICITFALMFSLSACSYADLEVIKQEVGNQLKQQADAAVESAKDAVGDKIQDGIDSVKDWLPGNKNSEDKIKQLILTQDDYETAFSNDNSFNWKVAYWSAINAFDTYKTNYSDSSRGMDYLGFKEVSSLGFNNDEMKALYGIKELDKPINGRKYIISVSFRGTYYGENNNALNKDYRNILTDLDASPVTWYTQPSGRYSKVPPGQQYDDATESLYLVQKPLKNHLKYRYGK